MYKKTVSSQVLERLPLYLSYLRSLPPDSSAYISATSIAKVLGLGEVQVRKDLAEVSDKGRPKIGYQVSALIESIEEFLGYNNINDAVIVGAGKLGLALLDYGGFKDYGLNIVAAFDADKSKDGTITSSGKEIADVSRFINLTKRMQIKMGIITVPAPEAQSVCDMMIAAGIKAIWNFAPTHLIVPDGILVLNENMAASLAKLSAHLAAELEQKERK